MATLNKWSGSFCSNIYAFIVSFVKGTIEVELGEPGTSYSSQCKMKYTGRYRYNQEVTGSLQADDNTFVCNIGGMEVKFTVTSRSDKYISGTYSIVSPYDEGTFNLSRC